MWHLTLHCKLINLNVWKQYYPNSMFIALSVYHFLINEMISLQERKSKVEKSSNKPVKCVILVECSRLSLSAQVQDVAWTLIIANIKLFLLAVLC